MYLLGRVFSVSGIRPGTFGILLFLGKWFMRSAGLLQRIGALTPLIVICLTGCGLLERDGQPEAPVAERERIGEEQLARRAEALRRLSSEDRTERERAAIVLLSTDDEAALKAVKEKLAGPADPEIKVDILRAIAFRADRRCFDAVLKAVQDPHGDVRKAAATALANYSRPEEIAAIIDYAESPGLSPQERELLFSTMGNGIFVEATPLLIEGLTSENTGVREAAWQSLRRIWDRDLSPSPESWRDLWEQNRHRSREEILEERLRDVEISLNAVRKRMRDLERELKEFSLIAMSDQRRSPGALVEALAGDNQKVMEYAAFTLNRMPEEALQELDLDERETYLNLRYAVREGSERVATDISELIASLRGAYREDLILDAFQLQYPQAVTAAISAVGGSPGEEVIKKLEELLRHTNARVRESAANALSASTEESTVAALRNALKDEEANVRWFAVESLRKLNETSAVPDLTELLEKDPSPLVREITATTLGQLLQPAAFPALRKALRDDNRRVREQAARALVALAANNPQRTLSIGETLVENSFLADAKKVLENAEEQAGQDESLEISDQIHSLAMALADGFMEQQEYSESARLYSKLLENPEYAPEARKKIAEAHMRGGNPNRLLEEYRQWLQTEDEDQLLVLIEEAIPLLDELRSMEMDEAAGILAGILHEAAETIDPAPEDVLQQIEGFREPADPDNGDGAEADGEDA